MTERTAQRQKLTAASGSAVLTELVRQGEERVDEVARDWQGYLRRNLELTPEQEEALRAMPAREVRNVRLALMAAAGAHGEVRLTIPEGRGDGEFSVRSWGRNPEDRLVIFHCHFGPGIRNWHCYWGPHHDEAEGPGSHDLHGDDDDDGGLPAGS